MGGDRLWGLNASSMFAWDLVNVRMHRLRSNVEEESSWLRVGLTKLMGENAHPSDVR